MGKPSEPGWYWMMNKLYDDEDVTRMSGWSEDRKHEFIEKGKTARRVDWRDVDGERRLCVYFMGGAVPVDDVEIHIFGPRAIDWDISFDEMVKESAR